MSSGNLSEHVEQLLRKKYGNMQRNAESWGIVRAAFHVDASHPAHDIALVNETQFVDLYCKEKSPPTAPTLLVVRFFPKTGGFVKGCEDSRWVDIGKQWLTCIDQSGKWERIRADLRIEQYDLEPLIACARRFIEHVDTGRTRRRIEDRLRKDPEFVKAIALIMGIS